ncbi:MAG: hypothetical protein J6W75_12755 [Bacteroidaceae bacterium]|nr:hypothetical protein [Bacteroidaceae bacterium]
MRKYLLLCLLTLGCVATFVACGKDDEDGNKSNSEVIFNEKGIVVTETEDQIVLIANLDNWDGEGVKATEK